MNEQKIKESLQNNNNTSQFFPNCDVLPYDIFTSVLKLLPVRDLIRAQRVCKTWYHEIQKDKFKKYIMISLLQERLTKDLLLKIYDLPITTNKKDLPKQKEIFTASLKSLIEKIIGLIKVEDITLVQIEKIIQFLKEKYSQQPFFEDNVALQEIIADYVKLLEDYKFDENVNNYVNTVMMRSLTNVYLLLQGKENSLDTEKIYIYLKDTPVTPVLYHSSGNSKSSIETAILGMLALVPGIYLLFSKDVFFITAGGIFTGIGGLSTISTVWRIFFCVNEQYYSQSLLQRSFGIFKGFRKPIDEEKNETSALLQRSAPVPVYNTSSSEYSS